MSSRKSFIAEHHPKGSELAAWMEEGRTEAGCDEAGRGCLAGPVVAAAVVIPEGTTIDGLNDSKKLTGMKRAELRQIIEAECCWSVGWAGPDEIDRINILNASILAMHRALEGLQIAFGHILVDGNRFKTFRNIAHTTVIRGDGLFTSIAAASVLAKTHRDEYMLRLHEEYPAYGWNSNMGYPTAMHRQAIHTYGVTPHHRKSFSLLPRQFSLF